MMRQQSTTLRWLFAGSALVLLLLVSARPTAAAEPPLGAHEALYLFVSASIPQPTLLTVAKDAAALHTPLILRGLVGFSLQETLIHLHPVVQTASLEIDPLLYDAYQVTAVPAVVLTCGGRGRGPYAILYGLSPSAALPRLRKQLTCDR